MGNVGLDMYERAIHDLDEVIRRDPQFAFAYANRAIAHTYLVRDSEAQRDIEQAVALGVDRQALEDQIEGLRQQR